LRAAYLRECTCANWGTTERNAHLEVTENAYLNEMPIQRPATIRHRTALFEDATAIVESEFGADLSLDDIARRVASSRRQLQRAYAEIGHTTFREHLTAVRMERAGELLTSRGLTVREVAHRVGYRQPAQFAKAFRRHHWLAPAAFRDMRRFRAATAVAA
jgi:AraC family transcriptional regulator, regulatory protein of adaptative response / methylphosphotriester-DNA alkyltransferase methyltransferase